MADRITRARLALEAAEERLSDAVESGEVIEGDRDWCRMADWCDELEGAYLDACDSVGR